MKIVLKPVRFFETCIISDMFINDIFVCNVLEDQYRKGIKVKHKTAIPAGVYLIIIDYSNRFNALMPHILQVPNFDGIRIHSGNTKEDTSGCLLVGVWGGLQNIQQSRVTYKKIFELINTAFLSNEKISIIINR